MVFTIEIKGLKGAVRLLNNMEVYLPGLKKRSLQEFSRRVKTYAKENIKPIYGGGADSEDLKNTILIRAGKDWRKVVATASYAGYVDQGTKGHEQPHNPIFKHIGHPGAQGYPSQFFMTRAFNRTVGEARQILQSEVDRYIQEVSK